MTNAQQVPFSRLRRLLSVLFHPRAIRTYWVLNLGALAALVIWICLDGRFSAAASWRLPAEKALTLSEWMDRGTAMLQLQRWPLISLMLLAQVTGLAMLVALFVGRQTHRSLRSWLAVMGVLALWLTLLMTWPSLAWRAQGWRLRRAIPAAEKLAQELLDHWPTSDGTHPLLGPYQAYPIGKPITLMFLQQPRIPGTGLAFSNIERSDSPEGHNLHILLVGREAGVWLVRTADDRPPRAFSSGLYRAFEPLRKQKLRSGWYAVVYSAGGIVDLNGSTNMR